MKKTFCTLLVLTVLAGGLWVGGKKDAPGDNAASAGTAAGDSAPAGPVLSSKTQGCQTLVHRNI